MPQGTVQGTVLFTIMVNDMTHFPMNKYVGDNTCSTLVGPSVTDNSDEVENTEAWVEENLL